MTSGQNDPSPVALKSEDAPGCRRRFRRLSGVQQIEVAVTRFPRFFLAAVCAVFSFATARAQVLPAGMAATRSASGQFVISGSKPVSALAGLPGVVTNTELVRLEPAVLAVSAERIKKMLWRQLGIGPQTPWRGQIFLALHPARKLDETVTIVSVRITGAWNYRVDLPDVLSRTRLVRALTGAILLELANRDNPGDHAAEIPAWLTEGMSQQFLAGGFRDLIVSPPDKLVNGLPENQILVVERGVDPLAKARAVLRARPALTCEQLSWPNETQLNGDDGGVYRASAQLFVSDLLALKDGARNLQSMLHTLPRCYNWQTAFRAAFAGDFPQPVDLEKWWALQTYSFAGRAVGSGWTAATSRDKLNEILSVAVEMRSSPTNLPLHAIISLQAVIRNFDYSRQTAVLQTKLRDLELAQYCVAPPFAVLTDSYRRTVAGYLGVRASSAHAFPAAGKNTPVGLQRTSAAETLKILDSLDAQRRVIELAIKPDVLTGGR